MHTCDVNDVCLFQSKGSCTCKSVMLEGMLKIYEEVFRDMKNKSEKKEVKDRVEGIMTAVKDLRHKYSEENKLLRDLQDIHLIKVRIKRKAVIHRS